MRRTFACICVIGLLTLSASAWGLVSGPLTVKATSGSKIATWTYQWVEGQGIYNLSAPVELRSADNTLLGTLTSLNCGWQSDPVLTLNFAVQAVGETNFFFDSGLLSFPAVPDAVAFATAAVTLTTDAGGGTFTGNFAGGKAYQATLNNGASVFANLDSTFSAPPDQSVIETERKPAVGFEVIGGPVSSMRAQWDFTLSDGDGASGTSRYELQAVPDANTLALAFAGAVPLLMGVARRRRLA